jgi:hypothetical protein
VRYLLFSIYGAQGRDGLWILDTHHRTGGRALLAISNGHGYRIDIATGRVDRFRFPQGQANHVAW